MLQSILCCKTANTPGLSGSTPLVIPQPLPLPPAEEAAWVEGRDRTWRPMLPTTMASDAGPHMARKGEIQRPAFADDSGCTISEGLLCLAGRQIQCCGLYVTRGPQLLSSLSFKS